MAIIFDSEEQKQKVKRLLTTFDAIPVQGTLAQVKEFLKEVADVTALLDSGEISGACFDPAVEALAERG